MYFQSRRLTLKVSFQKIGVLTILGQGPDITKSCLNMFPEIPGFLKIIIWKFFLNILKKFIS